MKTERKRFVYRPVQWKTGRISGYVMYTVLAVFLIADAGCSKSSDTNSDVTFKAILNGASETPPNESPATGTATLTYNMNTRIFTIVVNYTGVEATAAHIHKGEIGVAGGVIFGFPDPVTSPINYTSVALDSTQDADLNKDLYYVNIHSVEFPAGEIRGQLIKQ